MDKNSEQKENEEYKKNKTNQELTEVAIDRLAQILIMCFEFNKSKDKDNHERKPISNN